MKPGTKSLSLFLALVLFATVLACGQLGQPDEKATSPPEPDTATATPIPPIDTPAPPTDTPTPTTVPTATPIPIMHPNWTSYTNGTYRIADMAFDQDGYLWTASEGGGVVRWDTANGSYVKYTTEHGLPINRTQAIATASDGAIWVGLGGTFSGIGAARFDGQDWELYTEDDGLVSDAVTTIAAAPDGMWFGTDYGISFYDGTRWTNYEKEGWANTISDIAIAPDGTAWFATEGGVFHFDGDSWDLWTGEDGLSGDKTSSIAVTADGDVWAIGEWGDACHFDGTDWTIYDYDSGMTWDLRSVIAAPDGTVWFTASGAVVQFDGKEWTGYEESSGGGFFDFSLPDPVFAAAVAPDDTLWFATFKGGVSGYDGKKWTTHTTDDYIPDNSIRALAVAPDDSIWLGTIFGGAVHYDPSLSGEEAWTNYTTSDGLGNDDVWAIEMGVDEEVWTGNYAGGGVSHFDGDRWTTYPIVEDEYGFAAWGRSIAIAPDGTVWAGTVGDGAARFDGVTWTMVTQDNSGLQSEDVYAITAASDGSLWFGTWNGAFRYDGANWTHHLGNQTVYAIVEDADGVLWSGSHGDGVWRYDGSEWSTYYKSDGLCSDFVSDIAIGPDGTLWFSSSHIGGGDGICSYDGAEWTTYTTEDGLASNNANSIGVTSDGTVWIGTGAGLSRFVPGD